MLPTIGFRRARAQATARRLKSRRFGVHRVELDCIDEGCETVERSPEGRSRRIEGVGDDNQPVGRGRLRCLELAEGPDAGDRCRKVDEQHVPAADCALDAREQDHTACLGMGVPRGRIEEAVVQRDRKRVVAELRRVIDQLRGRMRDVIRWVLVGVRVQLDFQHPQTARQYSR